MTTEMAMHDLDTGPFIAGSSRSFQLFNGAHLIKDDSDGAIGFIIPAGQSGTDSYVKLGHGLAPAESGWLPDVTLELRIRVEVSPNYDQVFIGQPESQAGPVPGRTTVRLDRIDACQYLGVYRFRMPEGSTELCATVQARDTTIIETERTLRIRDVVVVPVDSYDPMRTPAQAAHQLSVAWLEQRLAARLEGDIRQIVYDMTSPDGGMAGGVEDLARVGFDLAVEPRDAARPAKQVINVRDTSASLSAHIASGLTPSPTGRRRLRLGAGTWRENGVMPRAFVDIVGQGQARTFIDGSLPNDADLDRIAAASTLEYFFDQDLEGVTVIARNCRYAIHADNHRSPFGLTQIYRDCTLIHEGNHGAFEYQSRLGAAGRPHDVWPNAAAFGGACYNGGRLELYRCTLAGDRLAAAVHNRVAAEARSIAKFHHCNLSGKTANGPGNAGRSLQVFNLGSGFNDTVEVVGCALDGDLHYFTSHWHVADLSYQPADHTEFHVVGHGNSPAVAIIEDFGRALRIDSAATEGRSTVEVTGGAVAILFGEIVSRDGAGGFRGYAHGTFDIQDRTPVGPKVNLFITGLGKRLGDCTTTRPSLVVRIDGDDAITITFDADYTSVPNTDILAMINSALGASATASEDRVGERYRPCFSDEERTYVNGSPTGITMGSAVAYGDDGSKYVRLMTDRDEAHMFAGIAWQDIYPGELGRVKTSGYLPLTDILCDDAAALVTGVALSPGPTPGRLVASSISPVARAIRPDAVRLLRP